MFYGKPLYVAIAQRKEERQAQLQFQYAQRVARSPTTVLTGGYTPVYYAPPGHVVPQVPSREGALMYQPFGLSPAGWRPNGFVAPSSRPIFQSTPLPAVSQLHSRDDQFLGF